MTRGRRRTTTEPTLVIDRASLPPVSRVPGPTIEQLADIERVRRDLENAVETMVPCPACANCGGCKGVHMVSPERARQLRTPPTLDEPGGNDA